MKGWLERCHLFCRYSLYVLSSNFLVWFLRAVSFSGASLTNLITILVSEVSGPSGYEGPLIYLHICRVQMASPFIC